MTCTDVIDFNRFSQNTLTTSQHPYLTDERDASEAEEQNTPDIIGNQPSDERMDGLEEQVKLLRESVVDLVKIIQRSESDIHLLKSQMAAQQSLRAISSQQAGTKSPEPKQLTQLADKIPYKMIGQLFQNLDSKTAPIPVYKLELHEKGYTASGKDKPIKYDQVHCGLYPDFGLEQLKKAGKHPANKQFRDGIPWITETLSAIRDNAKANGSLDRMTGGFFQNRKTKELLCHVVLVIDKVTMEGKLIFNCEAGDTELPFVMSQLKKYQKANRSADFINYFNVKDIRDALGGNDDEGSDCDDE